MILHRVQVLCPNKYEDYKIGTYDILKYIMLSQSKTTCVIEYVYYILYYIAYNSSIDFIIL